MGKDNSTYEVQIKPEEGYTLENYKDLIQFEQERIERLIRTHVHISEGNKFLVPVTQHPVYALDETIVPNNGVDLYQRYGTHLAHYGLPPRPQKPLVPHQFADPYELAPWPEKTASDEKIQHLLEAADKVICACDEFWAWHHHILRLQTEHRDINRYGWAATAAKVPVSLATSCYRFAPFTFQSWLYYRAPCETGKQLIIVDEAQFSWINKHAVDLLPADCNFLIMAAKSTQKIKNAQLADMVTRNGNALFTTTLAAIKAAQKPVAERTQFPKISIIVCSYNQGDFLEKCLISILDQQYPNLELIVVDGGSEDQSIAILEKYRPQLQHMIIEKDDGQSDALNKGFALSTGDIMTWICSDDGLEAGALHKVAQAFVQDKAIDIVIGGCRRIGPEGQNISIHHTQLPFDKRVRLSFGDMISFGYTWLRGFYFIQPELFWSRRIWGKSGSYIKNHMFFAMDYDLFLRFALAGAQAYHIPDCLAFAVVHEAQKSAHNGRNLPTILRMLDEFEEMLNTVKPKKIQ